LTDTHQPGDFFPSHISFIHPTNQANVFPISFSAKKNSHLEEVLTLKELLIAVSSPQEPISHLHFTPITMTTNKDLKATTETASASQTTHQTSRQQTPSQSYFSASPSPPPSTPPPSPPITQINNVPFLSRAIASESSRREYVSSGLKQLELQSLAHSKGQPAPQFDSSALRVDDFSQQSSSEDPVERFCVWDWVEDPNVLHARTAMAEIQQEPKAAGKIES